MEQISKDRVLAAVVSTFFKYFTCGLIEAQTDSDPATRYEPKNVKQTMLNHYDKIAPTFNQEAFYAIFRMNYDEHELEDVMRNTVTPSTTLMDLVRTACRTDDFYNLMVSEYKRNFELLLCGRIATKDEHEQAYKRMPSAGTMNRLTAESIINRIANTAYEQGRKLAE